MTNQTPSTDDMLSALADGQLDGDEFATALELASSDPQGKATWNRYHVIGDVLRSADFATTAADSAFAQRFRARLASQPLDMAQTFAVDDISGARPFVVPLGVNGRMPESANEPRFKWRWAGGFAALAMVVAVSWNLVPSGSQVGRELALVNGPSVAASQPGLVQQTVNVAGVGAQVMIRDPRLDQLLAAHKQFGGTSALQTPAGFLRNATFEEPAR